jgi:tetratricopeptide (TPR) repeat protein
MGKSLKSEQTVRKYLLGRVSDETALEGIEELLFTDEAFCSQVAMAEDDLINDYVLGRLNQADAESLRGSLAHNPERRFKVQLTEALKEKSAARDMQSAAEKRSFLASLRAFLSQPLYAGAFALVLIAVASLIIYLGRRNNADELAELRSIYQTARPTESRISQFNYAPLSQLRGAPQPAEASRLRRIENSLIENSEKRPTAETHHARGIFDLTQGKYGDAIKEFEAASKLEPNSARIHNDLGVAHFELSKTVAREKRLEELEQSLEEFTKATELDPNLLEALFNKSLALQELRLSREARKSWSLYLQKDPSSPWADEARKNLQQLQNEQSRFKNDAEVLSDFLTAYRNHDDARAQRIHNETKGLLRVPAVAQQLSHRLLIAKKAGNEAEARESLEALAYIAAFEQQQNSEFFFLN